MCFPAHALVYSQGFDDIAVLASQGWSFQNNSQPLGLTGWFQGNTTVFTSQSGPANSYLAANFNNTGSTGDISNWAITPEIVYTNGSTFSFYTRSISNGFADRLEVRLSKQGNSTNVGATSASVGDFTDLLLDINPLLTSNGYPSAWTNYQVTLSGLSGPTSGRIAFRYFVTNGGSNGANSDYIGIDTLNIQTADVPGPLPLLGALVAFRQSRKLRKRIG